MSLFKHIFVSYNTAYPLYRKVHLWTLIRTYKCQSQPSPFGLYDLWVTHRTRRFICYRRPGNWRWDQLFWYCQCL